MGIIYLLEELFGKVVFVIGEYQFEGIRPVKYIEFPWKNNNEMKEYIKGLEAENTPYSYKKFIYWEEQRNYQKMHIIFSRSFLCLVAGIFLLFLSIILLLIDERTATLITMTCGTVIFLLSVFLKVRVKRYYTSVALGQLLYSQFESWPE